MINRLTDESHTSLVYAYLLRAIKSSKASSRYASSLRLSASISSEKSSSKHETKGRQARMTHSRRAENQTDILLYNKSQLICSKTEMIVQDVDNFTR